MEGPKEKIDVIAELKQLRDAAVREDMANLEQGLDDTNLPAMVTRARELEVQYPDFRDYELYHLLIGSTEIPESSTQWDFPGNDSIEAFLRGL